MDNNAYINKLKNHSILSADDEKKLFLALNDALTRNKYKLANSIRSKIAEHHGKLVVSLANKYNFDNIETADLVNQGMIALMKCIDEYDVNGTARFSSFAYMSVRGYIIRFAGDNNSIVRHSDPTKRNLSKLRSVERELLNDGIKPKIKEIAVAMDKTEHQIVKLMDHRDRKQYTSLDESVNDYDDDTKLIDNIECDEKDMVDIDLISNRNRLNKILNVLDETQLAVMSYKWDLDIKTSISIDKLPIERIRQIEFIAMKRLRRNHNPSFRKKELKFKKLWNEKRKKKNQISG